MNLKILMNSNMMRLVEVGLYILFVVDYWLVPIQ